jgi:hypothetical protein
MKKAFCDICGKEILRKHDNCNAGDFFTGETLEIGKYEIYLIIETVEKGNDIDLCKDCMFDLIHISWKESKIKK